jgi:hypothetical protein
MTGAHQVIAAYWAAAEARDWDAFAGLLAEDVVYQSPQTREQVRGRTAYLRFNAEGFPGDWHLAVDRIFDFWPEPYDIPASRAHLVERY